MTLCCVCQKCYLKPRSVLVKKEKFKFIDVNNCANNEIERIEKTDEKVISYAYAVAKVK